MSSPSHSTGALRLEYRVRTDDRPAWWWSHPDQDGLWDTDLSLVEEELGVHVGIGATNPRIETRTVLA